MYYYQRIHHYIKLDMLGWLVFFFKQLVLIFECGLSNDFQQSEVEGKFVEKGAKKIFILLIIAFGLFVMGGTWFYPYSSISIKKSISFNADNIVVKEYLKDLNEFKKNYNMNRQNKDDITTDRTQYILQMYEQNWLISERPVKMEYQDLDTILIEVKETRRNLMDLAFKENYSEFTKDYLKYTIENCLAIEESIMELKNSQTHSRKTLNIQYRNLQNDFRSNFGIFDTFYREYQKEDLGNRN